MSMSLVLVKMSGELRGRIVETRGDLLTSLLGRKVSENGFDRESDVFEGLDYRDIALQAEDPDDSLYQLFQGEPLLEGYEWTYGPPAWFDFVAARDLHALLVEESDFWPFSEIAEFLGRAVAEGKGVIVGVA